MRIAPLALVLACLALAGCDEEGTGPADGVVVENAAPVSVTSVFIRDCPVKFWGEDRLPEDRAIPPGGRHDFSIGSGCWDILVYFSNEETVDLHNIEVAAGQRYVWKVDRPGSGRAD